MMGETPANGGITVDHTRDTEVTFDDIADALRALRLRRGDTSFAEISRRISIERQARGVPEAAATPPRSTVYNAFKRGRARMDADLVHEIALALGETEDEAEEWRAYCRRARRAPQTEKTEAPASADATAPRAGATAPPVEPLPAITVPSRPRLGPRGFTAVLAACIAVNLAGSALVAEFSLALFLDMIGTTVAAIALGPWYGVLVAVLTNSLAVATSDAAALPFMAVNVAGALIWGYGVRRFQMGKTFGRYLTLNLIVAVTCTVVATPILLLLFDGTTGHSGEGLAQTLQALGLPVIATVFASNLVNSLADKLISGFIALSALLSVNSRWRLNGVSLPLLDSLRPHGGEPAVRDGDGA